MVTFKILGFYTVKVHNCNHRISILFFLIFYLLISVIPTVQKKIVDHTVVTLKRYNWQEYFHTQTSISL